MFFNHYFVLKIKEHFINLQLLFVITDIIKVVHYTNCFHSSPYLSVDTLLIFQ